MFYIQYSERVYQLENNAFMFDGFRIYNPIRFKTESSFLSKLNELKNNPNIFDIKTDPFQMSFGPVIITYCD